MANHSTDRQRMRTDLRELAKLAKPVSGSPGPGFDTADSSGYVDLSAFSTSDAGWVDRELARAKKGAPPPPLPRARRIDVLTPQSMAPVALESLGDPEDTMNVRPARGRTAVTAVLGLAAIGVVGFLAFTLAKHPPPATESTATAMTAAAVAPPVTPDPAPPAVTSMATAPAPVVTAATPPPVSSPAPVAVAAPAAKKKSTPVPRTRVASAAPAPHAAAPAVAAVVIPKAKAAPAGGNDSLMDLIKKSVATGK